ncbi:hypothetical protein B566_EDAN015039 [Ephemera danica]|nr:hypothetical protein B566_EDAN015039 [Ephemera danica]
MKMATTAAISAIQSTAGAIPVRNEKGEVSMQKVKVHRYISGKRPDYAPDSSSDAESGDEDFLQRQRAKRYARAVAAVATTVATKEEATSEPEQEIEEEIQDRRLRRLKRTVEDRSDDDEDVLERGKRHRQVQEPEILEASDDEPEVTVDRSGPSGGTVLLPGDVESDEEENEVNEEERERRRALIRQKLLSKRAVEEMEVLEKEDDLKLEELKPVFVRKKDRLTVAEREKLAEKERIAELEAKRAAEERKRHSIKLVEEEVRKESALSKKAMGDDTSRNLGDVCTDDENDELEYEAWKLRELKRVKRDKDEKDHYIICYPTKEQAEIERLRGLTEEQRRQELRNRPKQVTNKAHKGKYKFLQKYYHRGAFYLNEEDDVYKRDFSAATLEDHFDKSVLPKVMQVKNFGRSGRTKYTHLVDQDTTQFDSPWAQDGVSNKTGPFKSAASGSAGKN